MDARRRGRDDAWPGDWYGSDVLSHRYRERSHVELHVRRGSGIGDRHLMVSRRHAWNDTTETFALAAMRLLELESVSKNFGGIAAVKEISLRLEQGEIRAI